MIRVDAVARMAMQVALMLAALPAARAEEAFVGRWSINPAGCASEGDTAATSPLIATPTTLKWFVSSCRIGKMYKVGHAVHMQAHCSSEGIVKPTPITLEARGDRLRVTWNGKKVEDMRRCR